MADKINNNPWLGLSSYKYEDASRFYGRDKELQDLAEIIRQNSFTTIYGVSGAGKTSIINAGLFPILDKEHYLPIYIRLNHGEGRLGYDEQIITAVENALVKVCAESELMVDANIESDLDKLWLYFHSHRFWTSDNHKLIPILFIDQFEEIFTKNEDVNDVWSFFNVIDSLQYNMPTERIHAKIQETDQCVTFGEEMNFRVVFSMREDFLPRLEDYCFDIPAMRRNRVGLKPLNGLQALEVITKPRPDVVSREVALHIISKVVGQEIKDNHRKLESIYVETSILSLFCSELYNYLSTNATSQNITRSLVDTYGENILELYYNRNMQMLPEKTYIYLEGQLLTHSGFRNSVAFEDLIVNGVSQEQLEQLEENRIIRIEDVYHVRRVEFTHDVLCKIAKEHRDKRLRQKKIRRNTIQNWMWAIEATLITIISLICIFRLYYTSREDTIIVIIKDTFIFVSCLFVLYFDKFSLSKVFSNKSAKILFLLSIVFSTYFIEVHKYWHLNIAGMVASYKYIPLISLNLIFLIIKERLQSKTQRMCYILLSLLTVLYCTFLCSAALWVLTLVISVFILSPFRLSRFKNKTFSVFSIIFSIISIISLIILYAESFYGASDWGLIFVLYPIVSLIYLKNKEKVSFKESVHYCVSLQIYEERPFCRNVARILTWIIIIASSILVGMTLNDRLMAVNIMIVGLSSYYLLKSQFCIKNDKSKFKESIIVISILMLTIIQQYIPYGIFVMCCISVISAIYIYTRHRDNMVSDKILFRNLSLTALWIIPFVVIPALSIGYNQFNLTNYARVYNGRIIYGRPYTRFIKIKDFSGNIGLRDRSNLIVPVGFQNIKLKKFDAEYFGKDFPLCIESENHIYENRREPNIIFTVFNHNGGKDEWICSEHLDMNNICTDFIVSTYRKMLENDNPLYIDYLLSFEKENKTEIENSSERLILDILKYDYPEYSIEHFFRNSKYLRYLSNDTLKLVFREYLPKRIKELDNKYNKNRLLIECACYQVLHNDIEGANKLLQDILKSANEQDLVSANRVLFELYLQSKEYNKADSIMKQLSEEEEVYFCTQNNNYYRKENFDVDKKIRFVDAIRNDIEMYKELKTNLDHTILSKYMNTYSEVPRYDYFEDYSHCNSFQHNSSTTFVPNNYRVYFEEFKTRHEGYSDHKYMYLMYDNKVVTPLFTRFSYIKDVDSDIITIIELNNNKRCFFNLADCKMVEGEYDMAWRFSEGHCVVLKNKKLLVINKKGQVVSNNILPYVLTDYDKKNWDTKDFYMNTKRPDYIFQYGACPIASTNGLFGLINYQGNWIIEPIYEKISRSFGDGYRIVAKNGKTGIIDKNGKFVITMEHRISIPEFCFYKDAYGYVFDDIEFNSEDEEENEDKFLKYINSYLHNNKSK